jgi:uncharacterized protein (DUF2336 family)
VTDKLSHLESLARLTVENSAEDRQNLLREVTDMFMTAPESLSEREVSYFGDIMGGMVGHVETMVRQHLSETIATVENAPRDLIVSLASDEIEVALPVLSGSQVLQDEDLIKIAENKSQDHLNAISKRPTVSESVTDVLVVKGDDQVLGTLAGNNGARFSRDGMETIIERAKDNDDLNQTLSERTDVPDDLAQDMFWRVSWAIREQILASDENLNDQQVDELIEEAEQWFAEQKEKRSIDPAENFVIRKEKLGQLDAGLLLGLVRQSKMPEFVAGLGRLANVDIDTVRQAVFDESAEKLAVICKAIDVNYDIFGEIVYCVNMEEERAGPDMEDLLGVYNRITPQIAQKSLRYLRNRKNLMNKVSAPN